MISTRTTGGTVDTLLNRNAVPIIDLSHCGIEQMPIQTVVNRVGLQLQKTFCEKGIAFLVNHGIADEKIKAAWNHFDDFLDLPADVKQPYSRKNDSNHGYVSPGMERFDGNTLELRHAFNICTLQGENFPRDILPRFADDVGILANDFKTLATFILRALAASLDIPDTFFLDNHSQMLSGEEYNMSTLRMLYYPSVVDDEPHRENKLIRCGAHVDYGTFTLLAQDSEGGLEVQLPGSEKWERVGHLPGAILINGGAILSIWTQKRYNALSHRVVIPEEEYLRSRGRHSLAYFCHPDNTTLIKPSELLPPDAIQDTSDERVYNAYQVIQQKFGQTYGMVRHDVS